MIWVWYCLLCSVQLGFTLLPFFFSLLNILLKKKVERFVPGISCWLLFRKQRIPAIMWTMQISPRPAWSTIPNHSQSWLRFDSALERLLRSVARVFTETFQSLSRSFPLLQTPSYRNPTVHVMEINILLLHGEESCKQRKWQVENTSLDVGYDKTQAMASVGEGRGWHETISQVLCQWSVPGV